MPNRTVSVPEELNVFIEATVASGRFHSADEVVATALRAFEREEREDEEKMAFLRSAVDDGDASPDAEADVFARVRRESGL